MKAFLPCLVLISFSVFAQTDEAIYGGDVNLITSILGI